MTVYVIDRQIQSMTLNRRAGSIEPYAGAVPSPENTIEGINWNTKCPWQITLSTDAIKKMTIFYGTQYDTEFRSHLRAHSRRLAEVSHLSNKYRLFTKLKGRDEAGWFREEMESTTYGESFDFDGTNYTASFSMDWRLTERKQRMLDLCAGETYIPNVMDVSRPAFAGEMEWMSDCSEVCVKFLPADFYGEYDKWENGMHIQTAEAGNFTVHKRGTGKNYIVLTNEGVTRDGVTLNRGRPYTLTSSSLELQSADNYILQINEK